MGTDTGPRRRVLRHHTSAPVSVKASRGLAIASKRSSIALSRMSFAMPLTTSAVATLVNLAARIPPSRFYCSTSVNVPCVIEQVVKNKGEQGYTRFVACTFVLIASLPIRRREDRCCSTCNSAAYPSRKFSAQLKVSNCDICRVCVWGRGGGREDAFRAYVRKFREVGSVDFDSNVVFAVVEVNFLCLKKEWNYHLQRGDKLFWLDKRFVGMKQICIRN